MTRCVVGPAPVCRFGSVIVSLAVLAATPPPAGAQTSLTIYNDGRVLERRVFAGDVPAGISIHRLALGQIDLGSLFSLDSMVVLTGANYDAAQDETNALRRAIGRRLVFRTGGRTRGVPDSVVAEVVAVDPERFRLGDGRVTFRRPGIPLFPPEMVPDAPATVISVRALRGRRTLRLGYFTSGASWRAVYAITLAGRTARVVGHAAIRTGRLRADSAEIQLLAGSVGRAAPAAQEVMALRTRGVAAEAAVAEQVGEAHLYTLPDRHSLMPGVEMSAMLFEPASAPVARRYEVRGQVPFRGPLPQFGDEAAVPIVVTYTLSRGARTGFGDLSLPAGVARIYQADADGRAQLIGESALGHTAAGQDLQLDAGTAFDLTARRTQTTYQARRTNLRTEAFADYRVTVANAKDSAAVVDVLERRGGEWDIVSSSLPVERISSTSVRFRLRVPARSESTLTYRVRVVW